jgi:hypothetical protein
MKALLGVEKNFLSSTLLYGAFEGDALLKRVDKEKKRKI